MGMSWPFTPEDVNNRYRRLAKEWHPDLNPGDPTATERMKALNSAVQLLTASVRTLCQCTPECSTLG